MARQGLIELEAVLAIAAQGSFRAAADELGLSTSALSSLIARLERELGVRLFNRTTRSVALSDAGRIFVDQISPALRDIRQAMAAVRAQQETPSGTLRINAFASGAREILAPLVLAFVRRYPQVHVDLVTEGRIVDIVAEGFDLGLRTADMVPSDMIAVPLGAPRRFAVVATPGYLDLHGRPQVPPDLLAHRCIRIRLPSGALYRWHFEKDGNPVQIDVAGPLTLDETTLARIAVLEGIGIGFFMEADAREDLESGRLERVLADWTPPTTPLCLYYPGRRNMPAAQRAFVDMAREFGRARAS
jgi:DNA-binding transcriptional LysR family regulator